MKSHIARAPLNLLWLQSGGCGGCTLSLLNADCRNLFDTLKDFGINLLWHPSLSEQSADEALRIFDACASGETSLDILCLEGSVLKGPFGSGGFHRRTGSVSMMSMIERLAKVAKTHCGRRQLCSLRRRDSGWHQSGRCLRHAV